MDLRGLRSKLWARHGSVQTLNGTRIVEHSYPDLARDAGAALNDLRQWGVGAGMRVGIYAQNCYEWLVYDLALIELDAVVVPFTRDFAGTVNEALFDKYRLSLVLVSREMAPQIPSRPSYLAFIDDANQRVRARMLESGALDDPDTLSLVFSSGSAGGIKGIVISRQGLRPASARSWRRLG